MTTQQKHNDQREHFLLLLRDELTEKRKRPGADNFINWLARSDFFDAPLILPGIKPESVTAQRVSSYRVGGFAQAGLAFCETLTMLNSFTGAVKESLEQDGFFNDSFLLCSMALALDCTSRFTLNPATGMYEDSIDSMLLPPGLRRSVFLVSCYMPLSMEEIIGMAYAYPGIMQLAERSTSSKKEWFEKFSSKHQLALHSYVLHDFALRELREKMIANEASTTTTKS